MNFIVDFYKHFGPPKPFDADLVELLDKNPDFGDIVDNFQRGDKQYYAVVSGVHEKYFDRYFGRNGWSFHQVPMSQKTEKLEGGRFGSSADFIFCVPSYGIIYTVSGSSDNELQKDAEAGNLTAAKNTILRYISTGFRRIWENKHDGSSVDWSKSKNKDKNPNYKSESLTNRDQPSNSSTPAFKWLNPDAKHDSDEYRQWLNYLNAFKASNQTPQQFRTSQIPEGYNLANKYMPLLVK
ncbi:MAG: hypothetical protein ACRDBG_10785 [Waterburya sp.]